NGNTVQQFHRPGDGVAGVQVDPSGGNGRELAITGDGSVEENIGVAADADGKCIAGEIDPAGEVQVRIKCIGEGLILIDREMIADDDRAVDVEHRYAGGWLKTHAIVEAQWVSGEDVIESCGVWGVELDESECGLGGEIVKIGAPSSSGHWKFETVAQSRT